MSTVMLNKRAMKRLAKDFSALTKEPLVNANARPTDDMSMWDGTISKKIFFCRRTRNLLFFVFFLVYPMFLHSLFPLFIFLEYPVCLLSHPSKCTVHVPLRFKIQRT